MSPRAGQMLLAGALFVSLATHLGVMYAVRSQVMTNYAAVAHHAGNRRAMEMRQVRQQRPPEAIRLTDVPDRSPLRDSPAAATEALQPAMSVVETATPEGVTLPLPEDPEMLLPEQPVREVAPRLFEKVRMDDIPSYVTPLAKETGPGLTPPSSASAPPVKDAAPLDEAVATVAPEAVAVPAFEAPEVAVEPVPQEASSLVENAAREDARQEFTPLRQVMDEVDENIVAAEKKAVRELLDVRRPQPLPRFVSVGINSAEAGEWTYFRVRVKPEDSLKVVPKDIVILIDASGSISDDRLKSCRAAAKEILRSCMNTGDRFNLVAFRNDFDYAFREWQSCTQPVFNAADKWMDRLTAHGRTDVFSTIASVLKLPRDPKRPLIALVVTDGDANSGVSRTAEILSKFTALNDGLVSIYMYGVKQGANRELIDVLTRGNRGESFIYEGNRKYAGRMIGELSERFRDPVLSDLRLVFTTASKADAYPRRLRNLYRGESVDIIGRAPAGTSQVAFSLKGLNGARAYEGMFKITLGQGGPGEFDPDLPAQWLKEQAIDRKLHAR